MAKKTLTPSANIFGRNAAFCSLQSVTDNNKTPDELLSGIEDEQLKAAIIAKREGAELKRSLGGGRKRNADADDWTRMTFVVRKDQLQTLRLIGVIKGIQTKSMLAQALADYIQKNDDLMKMVQEKGLMDYYKERL